VIRERKRAVSPGCFAILAMLVCLPLALTAGEKRYAGLASESVNWEKDSNWTPVGAPTLEDTAYIGWANPYVAITGTTCFAHTVILQNGGRLVLRKADGGNTLTVAHDFIVETGGIFNTTGTPGGTGPLVYIGGNVVNDGIWDLSGVSSNGMNRGVVFNGIGTQTISGSSSLTFHNLTNSPNDSLIIIGTHVGVAGRLDPRSGILVFTRDGGSFVVGSQPLTIVLDYFSAVRDTDIAAIAVHLGWVTSMEYNNKGFFVERKEASATGYDSVAFVPSLGSGVQLLVYTVLDTTVTAGTWDYRLRAIDTLGNQILFTPVSIVLEPLTGVAESGGPSTWALSQNFPNPFNPETKIRFSVASAGRASLRVYNPIGQEVAMLFDGEVRPGVPYTAVFLATHFPSGVYFYCLKTDARLETRRMVLLK
jgi:hypothetical protein